MKGLVILVLVISVVACQEQEIPIPQTVITSERVTFPEGMKGDQIEQAREIHAQQMDYVMLQARLAHLEAMEEREQRFLWWFIFGVFVSLVFFGMYILMREHHKERGA